MIVLSVEHIAKAFGTDEVLSDVSFALQTGERMGLVGVNGSGKTTLLRIISGELQADEGNISLAKGVKIGYLNQIIKPKPGNTVLMEAEDSVVGIRSIEQRMRLLEHNMGTIADTEELDNIMSEYARLTERFEASGGYEINSQIVGVLTGLGFTQEQLFQAANTLSGGELTRLGLAKLLLQKPDLLLLDEPTNHLDMATLQWLENYLLTYPGSIIMVSHDRYFLDAICSCMVELVFGESEYYLGNYSIYQQTRQERYSAREKAWKLQQKEIKRQKEIIARFRSFNREKSIRAAESREKALNRMELLDRPQEEQQITFRFQAKRRIGDIALVGKSLKKSYGNRVLFNDLNINISGGDRVALIGANGVGKTTLLRCLMGIEPLDEGEFRVAPTAQIGYFDQRQQDLDPQKDVLNEVWDAFPLMNQSSIRGALGLFLFTGDDVFTPISLLSGGERSRVSLTKLMLKKDNMLLMDEPTNHLDADSREALEKALEGFNGTILTVSHDRYFINRIANQVIVLDENGLTKYEGNYNDYLQELQRRTELADCNQPDITKTECSKIRREERIRNETLEILKNHLLSAEQAVHQAENDLAAATARLGDPDIYMNPDNAAAQARICRDLKEKVDLCYQQWDEAQINLDAHTGMD